MAENKNPVLSIVVLSWNREYLLRSTILSILATTKLQFELTIVDNASTDGSENWLKIFQSNYPSANVIFLDQNFGGEALNIGAENARGEYIFFSENDLEFLPGWDDSMVQKFIDFPELGQLSPFGPIPMREIGEEWIDKPYEVLEKNSKKLFKAVNNVTTTCMIRSSLFRNGLRWKNIESKERNFFFPSDASFSSDVKGLGFCCAWNEKYQVINWGFNKRIVEKEKEYYFENWKEKSNLKIDGIDIQSITNELQEIQDVDLKKKAETLLSKIAALQIELNDCRNKSFGLEGESVQLYWFEERYCDENSFRLSLQKEKLVYEFSLNSQKKYTEFRVDPSSALVEIKVSKVYVKNVSGEKIPLKLVSHNGFQNNENEFIFYHSDPQLFYRLDTVFENLTEFIFEIERIESRKLLYHGAIQNRESIIKDRENEIFLAKTSRYYKLGHAIFHPIHALQKLYHKFIKSE